MYIFSYCKHYFSFISMHDWWINLKTWTIWVIVAGNTEALIATCSKWITDRFLVHVFRINKSSCPCFQNPKKPLNLYVYKFISFDHDQNRKYFSSHWLKILYYLYCTCSRSQVNNKVYIVFHREMYTDVIYLLSTLSSTI